MEHIITSSTEHDPYDQLKAELVRRLSTSREQSVRQLVTRGNGRQEAIEVPPAPQGPRHQTSQMIFFAPSESADSHRTYKPYLPARLRAVSSQPPTSRTEFVRSLPWLPQQASPLRRPTTQPSYYSVSRSSRTRLPHCAHHKLTAAHSPEAATSHTRTKT